jgi:hypothetical protein
VDAYDLATNVIVAGIPTALVTLVIGVALLVRDSTIRSPRVALVGHAATLVAFGMLFVERPCGETVNRPIIVAVLGPGACRAGALAAVQVVLLLAVGTALAVRLLEPGSPATRWLRALPRAGVRGAGG